MERFTFPVGYHHLHKVKIINYQMNRWYSFGYTRLEDMAEAAGNIRTLDEWKPEMIRQAEKALTEKRMMNAAFYYRAAEFFTFPYDPDKQLLYDKFVALFYQYIVAEEKIERISIPYEDAFLPALRISTNQPEKKGTIVIHGGFDSFMEEFYSIASYFSSLGYEIILFEGPGQGAALKKYGLPLTYTWEKPARAVLNFFNLQDVSWLGISLGGWLCFRAAAIEPRIRRVIAFSIAFDYLQIPPAPVQILARFLLRFPKIMNYLAELKAKKLPQERWGLYNMMYIFKADTPIAATLKMLEFNEQNQHAERVKQDMLILTGAEDHFIPLKMHHKQVRALTSAKSVTERIFTRKEQGQNHCQVGNIGLALEVVAKWLAEKS